MAGVFTDKGLHTSELQRYIDTGKMPGTSDVLPYSENTWKQMVDGSLANR